MIRYKLYGILSLFIFSLPFFSTSHQRETPKSQKAEVIFPALMAKAFPLNEKKHQKKAFPLNEKKHQKKKKHGINVTASIYYPEVAQTDSTPLITADGSRINKKKPRKPRWVALSRNLLKIWGGKIDYGDSLRVKGISPELDGIYVVRDTMKRRLRNRVDILVGAKDNIMGRWDNVQIYHLN
jgi:3D (Asp-Asp-Asp) domain-containing protein